MAWYDEAVFYHIYPLGLTGAPKQNWYGEPEHRLNTLLPWISHIKEIGCNGIYIGPLFESVGHGYETTDYKKLDSRLGTNEDLTNFVTECHRQGIRVILDGVFNHTGRDFFAFQDIKRNRENSPYKDWYCNVNFWGNTEYNDGFSYENWGGYNLLVKLNQHNPAVRDYICDVIRFWVKEFDIDGIRLDAADVLDFNYMQAMRQVANEVKPDFWLMGEVIHGDYTKWVNEGTLHSVTNYHLHKALYSGCNDHNFFEIAHTVKRQCDMGMNRPDGMKLYNFVDNHDVERIYTKLNNKAHFAPVHILMYTLPGIPSIYYGSEFGIEGRKERWSDDSLRPALNLADFADAKEKNSCTKLIAALGEIRQKTKALAYGDYKELMLDTRHYAFSRTGAGETAVVTVNNDDNDYVMNVEAGCAGEYVGLLTGTRAFVNNGRLEVVVKGNSGDIWVPVKQAEKSVEKCASEKSDTVVSNVEITEKAETSVESIEAAPAADLAEVSMEENVEAEEETTDTAADTVDSETPMTENLEAESETTGKATDIVNAEAPVEESDAEDDENSEIPAAEAAPATIAPETVVVPQNKSYEEMTIEELQAAILEKMRKNGPVTDRMRQDVIENVYHSSLVTWVKSFQR